MTILLIAFFGALGCVSRYGLSGWVYSVFGNDWPYGTLFVNVLGAFFIGLIMEVAQRTTLVPQELRVGLTIGFLGGLTTFSTFSFETFRLLQGGRLAPALVNVLGSVVACLVFTFLGIVVARQL